MTRTFCATVCLTVFLACSYAAAFTVPDHWQDVGTVDQWRKMDSHFFRIVGLTGCPGPEEFNFDQKSIYAKTIKCSSPLGRIDLESFQALSPSEKEQRQSAAGRKLRKVQAFRYRIADLVMSVMGQYVVGWGTRDGDTRSIGDAVTHLQTAVSVDPSNAYAWHLLSYLTTNIGDYERALNALDGCDAVLATLPDTVLVEMRQRSHLDRAWLYRDLGYFAQASEVLDELASKGFKDREAHLIRGLIAAQTGDINRAFRIAGDLRKWDLPVFQIDWEAQTIVPGVLDPHGWSKKPSTHIHDWILALAWLQEGAVSQAKKAFREYSLDRHYEFGRRFMDEAAHIYEATGRYEVAQKFWPMAHLYVPYQPYMIYKSYGTSLTGITGRPGFIPFTMGYDSHLQCGSRLSYGMALVSQALNVDDRGEQVALATKAVAELEVCLRTGFDKPTAALVMGYAQAIRGNSFEMLRAADTALAALDQPLQDQFCRQLVEKMRASALAMSSLPGLDAAEGWTGTKLIMGIGESHSEAELRLRDAYAQNPDDGDVRRELARFLIRFGDPVEAAALVEQPLQNAQTLNTRDWVLVLELDRLRNDKSRAVQMLERLSDGQAQQWPDASLWTLVGIICEEHGLPAGRDALQYALALDPNNKALSDHLNLTVPVIE